MLNPPLPSFRLMSFELDVKYMNDIVNSSMSNSERESQQNCWIQFTSDLDQLGSVGQKRLIFVDSGLLPDQFHLAKT